MVTQSLLAAITPAAAEERDLLASVIAETEQRASQPVTSLDVRDDYYQQLMQHSARRSMCYCGDPNCPGPSAYERQRMAGIGPMWNGPIDLKW